MLDLVLGDFWQMSKSCWRPGVFDGVCLSPPWGEHEQCQHGTDSFKLSQLGSKMDGCELLAHAARYISPNVAFYLPRSISVTDIELLNNKMQETINTELAPTPLLSAAWSCTDQLDSIPRRRSSFSSETPNGKPSESAAVNVVVQLHRALAGGRELSPDPPDASGRERETCEGSSGADTCSRGNTGDGSAKSARDNLLTSFQDLSARCKHRRNHFYLHSVTAYFGKFAKELHSSSEPIPKVFRHANRFHLSYGTPPTSKQGIRRLVRARERLTLQEAETRGRAAELKEVASPSSLVNDALASKLPRLSEGAGVWAGRCQSPGSRKPATNHPYGQDKRKTRRNTRRGDGESLQPTLLQSSLNSTKTTTSTPHHQASSSSPSSFSAFSCSLFSFFPSHVSHDVNGDVRPASSEHAAPIDSTRCNVLQSSPGLPPADPQPGGSQILPTSTLLPRNQLPAVNNASSVKIRFGGDDDQGCKPPEKTVVHVVSFEATQRSIGNSSGTTDVSVTKTQQPINKMSKAVKKRNKKLMPFEDTRREKCEVEQTGIAARTRTLQSNGKVGETGNVTISAAPSFVPARPTDSMLMKKCSTLAAQQVRRGRGSRASVSPIAPASTAKNSNSANVVSEKFRVVPLPKAV